MLDKCFTCLDDITVYPVVPKATFVPNERVWIAENPDFFFGLEGPWPKTYPPVTTDFMRVRKPTFPPVELGQIERTPAQKLAAVAIGGALLYGLFRLAPRITAVPERRY